MSRHIIFARGNCTNKASRFQDILVVHVRALRKGIALLTFNDARIQYTYNTGLISPTFFFFFLPTLLQTKHF